MDKFKSIVVGLDFSECSAVAMKQAMRVAKASGAQLHPIHVLDTHVVTELESAINEFQHGLRDQLRDDARSRYAEFAKNIPGAEKLELDVEVDALIRGLLRTAARHKPDLFVIGAYGRRKADVGMGTVATGCVRKSMAPVLVVRDTQTGPFKNIIACVDFSDTSQRALEAAAQFAKCDGSDLHLLHLFDAPWNDFHYRSPTPEAKPDFKRQYRGTLEAHLKNFGKEALAGIPSDKVHFHLIDEPSHREGIVEFVRKLEGDLVVVGTRGKSNLRDVLLGSTAEKVLGRSPCSVLAVKPEGFEHPFSKA